MSNPNRLINGYNLIEFRLFTDTELFWVFLYVKNKNHVTILSLKNNVRLN